MVHKCHTLAALKQRVVMARWVGEETLKELSVQVTVQVPLREVTVEAAHLRSPGGTKPMRRSYTFVPTPEVAAFDDQLAKKVHKENCQQRERVDAAFEKAAAEQPRIEARRRDACSPPCQKCSSAWLCPRCASCCSCKEEGSRHSRHCRREGTVRSRGTSAVRERVRGIRRTC